MHDFELSGKMLGDVEKHPVFLRKKPGLQMEDLGLQTFCISDLMLLLGF
jgi:hypothetical protein